ncbi:hypothetical protein [Wukongibacter sp. M2B1]|uniref:hypothetical protein n=1 Tax=Wukongibacter sp. M2B1 TaxID=3088895 RepID=UPI003D7BD487
MALSKGEVTVALAIVNSSMFLGQFSSPILTTFFQHLLNSTSTRIAFYTSSLLCLISIMVIILKNSMYSSQQAAINSRINNE